MASVRHIITLMLVLTLAFSSCRSKKEVTHTPKPRTTRTTGHDDGSKAETDNDHWKRLDIPLTRHDNKRLYHELRQWLGTPYKYAAANKGIGTDCSGMVMMVYKEVFDIKLERNSARIFERNCRKVSKDKLKEGDLVFFNNGGDRITHVGIYLKNGYFVHASSSRGVIVSHLTERYYVTHFHCAGRVIAPDD